MLKKIFTLPTSSQTTTDPIFTLNVNMAEIPKYSIIKKAIVTFKADVGFTWLSPTIKIEILDSTGTVKYTSPAEAVPKQPKKFTFNKLQAYFKSDETIQKVQIMGIGTYRYWEVIDAQLEIDYEPPTFQIIIGTPEGGTVQGQSEIITVTPDTIITRTLNAVPNEGYGFKEWKDSNGIITTTPTLTINISDQIITQHKTVITYTPQFLMENRIYIGKVLMKKIYLGTTPVKEAYIGTQCIYKNRGN